LTNILKPNATLALVSLDMFVVIVTAGIDLSVGSTLALSMVTLAIASRAGLPWPVVLLIGPLVGIAVGIVKCIGISWPRLPRPFIMTLGTLNAVRGITYLVTDGAPVSGLQPEVRYLGQAYYDLGIFAPPAGIPASLILVVVCAVGLWFFLEKTSTGRH